MTKFRIQIVEMLTTSVLVDAETSTEANDIVREMYHDEQIVLTDKDYYDTEFYVMPNK